MCHKHIVQFFAHCIENGKTKNAIHNVKRSSLRITVVNDEDVLSRKKTAEKRFRILVDGVFHAVIVPTTNVPVNTLNENLFSKISLNDIDSACPPN